MLLDREMGVEPSQTMIDGGIDGRIFLAKPGAADGEGANPGTGHAAIRLAAPFDGIVVVPAAVFPLSLAGTGECPLPGFRIEANERARGRFQPENRILRDRIIAVVPLFPR